MIKSSTDTICGLNIMFRPLEFECGIDKLEIRSAVLAPNNKVYLKRTRLLIIRIRYSSSFKIVETGKRQLDFFNLIASFLE